MKSSEIVATGESQHQSNVGQPVLEHVKIEVPDPIFECLQRLVSRQYAYYSGRIGRPCERAQ